MNLINLQHKKLTLYFCTALFCHVVLFSSLYSWSNKPTAGTQQARSVTTYFVPMITLTPNPSPASGRGEQKKVIPLPSPASGRGVEGKGFSLAHHGNSTLLAALHRTIEQHQTYPFNAIMAQQSGTAVVDFTLLPDGTIMNSTLHQSSGYAELDQAALTAVQAISPFKAIAIHTQQNFDVAVSFSLQ